MQENPYSVMLEMFRKHTTEKLTNWILGKVTSTSPLAVSIGDHVLAGKDLLINQQLLSFTQAVQLQNIKGELAGTDDLDIQSGHIQASASFGTPLQFGDQVLLLPSKDGQQFVVLCKVV